MVYVVLDCRPLTIAVCTVSVGSGSAGINSNSAISSPKHDTNQAIDRYMHT
jgi:hypothetical protein